MRHTCIGVAAILVGVAGLVWAGPQLELIDSQDSPQPVNTPAVINDLTRVDDYIVPRMAEGDPIPPDPNGMGPGGVFAQVDAQDVVEAATPGVYSSVGQGGLRYSPAYYGGGGGSSPAGGGTPIYPGGGGTTTIIEVPEPATMGLLGSGAAAIFLRRRRRSIY